MSAAAAESVFSSRQRTTWLRGFIASFWMTEKRKKSKKKAQPLNQAEIHDSWQFFFAVFHHFPYSQLRYAGNIVTEKDAATNVLLASSSETVCRRAKKSSFNQSIRRTPIETRFPPSRLRPIEGPTCTPSYARVPFVSALTLFTWILRPRNGTRGRKLVRKGTKRRAYPVRWPIQWRVRYASTRLNSSENNEIPSEIFVILNNITSPCFSVPLPEFQRDRKGPFGQALWPVLVIVPWEILWTGPADKEFYVGQPEFDKRGRIWIWKVTRRKTAGDQRNRSIFIDQESLFAVLLSSFRVVANFCFILVSFLDDEQRCTIISAIELGTSNNQKFEQS